MTYHARFNDVVGLRSGSAVRMGGIDVGSVSDVVARRQGRRPKIYVTIVRRARTRRAACAPDTVARVVNKGLLGDKMIDLSGGDPRRPPPPDDSFIASEEDPSDMGKAIEKIDDVAKKADLTMDAIKRTSEQLADPQMTEDIKGSVKSLRDDPRRRREQQGRRGAPDDLRPRGGPAHRSHPREPRCDHREPRGGRRPTRRT